MSFRTLTPILFGNNHASVDSIARCAFKANLEGQLAHFTVSTLTNQAYSSGAYIYQYISNTIPKGDEIL